MIHDKSLWQKINFDFRAPIWKRPKSQKYTYPNAQKIHIQYPSYKKMFAAKKQGRRS